MQGRSNTLPEFKGYTVDVRLREFRKMILGKTPEFISFDSPQGQTLWAEFQKAKERKVRYTGNNPWLQSFDYFVQDDAGSYYGVYIDHPGAIVGEDGTERRLLLESRFQMDIEQNHNERG